MITFVDLFSGVGGMSKGFERENFVNLFSIDCNEDVCDTYRRNFPNNTQLGKKVEDLTEKEILELLDGKDVDLVIGGTPCQGFSIAGSIGRNFIDDPRNHLFKEFARVVRILKPKFFVIENVARVHNHNKGRTRKEIFNLFGKLGYKVDSKILDAADYGVPQHRRRIFIIGNNIGVQNKFPEKTIGEYSTVEDAISGLPELESGEESEVANHTAMNHSEQMLKKMSYVKNGGNREQIPSRIRPRKGDVRKYIKHDKSMPSVCVTGDMRKIFHYSQNRALTVREIARLQTFDDNFVFEGNSISQQQQVGDAVPPLMAQALAKTIMQQIEKK